MDKTFSVYVKNQRELLALLAISDGVDPSEKEVCLRFHNGHLTGVGERHPILTYKAAKRVLRGNTGLLELTDNIDTEDIL